MKGLRMMLIELISTICPVMLLHISLAQKNSRTWLCPFVRLMRRE
jgi:hypothetical protein